MLKVFSCITRLFILLSAILRSIDNITVVRIIQINEKYQKSI